MPGQIRIVEKASEFVAALFRERLPVHLVYHTYKHSEMVARMAEKIGEGMELGEEGIEVVTLAGWLHDTGYTELYKGHEEISVRIAIEFLTREQYPLEKIDLVVGCIRATKIPQQPKNLLEEIVADADLSGFGKKSFFEKAELLRQEWKHALARDCTDEEWAQQNLELLTGHKYFTSFAREAFGQQQSENIRIIYQDLHKFAEIERALPVPESEVSLPNGNNFLPPHEESEDSPSERKNLPYDDPDKKAHTLIIVNSLILIVVFSIIFRRISEFPDIRFMIPVFALLAASTISIVFAVLTARPGSEESIYSNYEIKFEKKLRYLNLGYTIFMYGLCISAASLIFLYFFNHI
jgi:predicted metal-dependent HD superfamily phosphohydrolase